MEATGLPPKGTREALRPAGVSSGACWQLFGLTGTATYNCYTYIHIYICTHIYIYVSISIYIYISISIYIYIEREGERSCNNRNLQNMMVLVVNGLVWKQVLKPSAAYLGQWSALRDGAS